VSDLPDWANTLAIPAVTSAIVAYVVTLAKTQGEIKKLRHEQRTAHFSHRQGCYHDLLNAERRVRAVLWETGYKPRGRAEGLAVDQRRVPGCGERRHHRRDRGGGRGSAKARRCL